MSIQDAPLTSQERLYRVARVHRDDADEIEEHELTDAPQADPEGWAEFCEWKWGEYRPFFFPSTTRIYRSRSAAQERATTINRWGGEAVVLVCVPEWQTIENAKRERELARSRKRVEALEGEIARELRRRADVDEHLRALED